MMIEYRQLIERLSGQDVGFVIVGGVAAVLHGSSRLTQDLDIVYARTSKNLDRIVRALADQEPYLRGAPPGLPFKWNSETLKSGLNFTLQTKLGPIDLLGEIAGAGSYDALREHTIDVVLYGVKCKCIDLETLIASKRAAGRPKDFEALAELEAIQSESK